MAPPLEDLTRLLAELATRLSQPPAGGGSGGAASTVAADALSASISSLAGALNPSSDRAGAASSGTRVLDTALSLMCFDPLEVGRARVDWLVRTLVSALSASISCRVVRPVGGAVDEMLCVGSSISPGDCRELVQLCDALVPKLEDCAGGSHSYDLVYASAKSAVLSPLYRCLFPLPYYREDEESVYDMGTISAELTNHPSYQVLPSDHSIPLRVFLWHLDPSIFKYDLSAMLKETIRRPLLCLRKELHCRMEWRIIIICLVCSPSMFMEMRSLFHFWFLETSMMMNFPAWFSFATTLLFYREGLQDHLSETLSKEIIVESISDVSLAQSAAFYLAWVLCPSNDDQCQMLANNILDLSHSWARNNKISPSCHTNIVNHRRKLKIPTAGDLAKLNVTTDPVNSLIKEFDESCVKFCCVTAVPLMQAEGLSDFRPSCQNLLHLWLPLGVLLVSSSWVNEQSCDLLLHYTSMGQVLEANEMQRKTKDRVSNDGFSASGRAMAERWALSGSYLIFGWLDIVEDMVSVIFDSEDTCQRFVSQLQTKIGPYLLRCVALLLEVLNEGDQDTDFAIDLHDRLLYWSKNGQSCKEFEGVILRLKKKFNLPL